MAIDRHKLGARIAQAIREAGFDTYISFAKFLKGRGIDGGDDRGASVSRWAKGEHITLDTLDDLSASDILDKPVMWFFEGTEAPKRARANQAQPPRGANLQAAVDEYKHGLIQHALRMAEKEKIRQKNEQPLESQREEMIKTNPELARLALELETRKRENAALEAKLDELLAWEMARHRDRLLGKAKGKAGEEARRSASSHGRRRMR